MHLAQESIHPAESDTILNKKALKARCKELLALSPYFYRQSSVPVVDSMKISMHIPRKSNRVCANGFWLFASTASHSVINRPIPCKYITLSMPSSPRPLPQHLPASFSLPLTSPSPYSDLSSSALTSPTCTLQHIS
jgi:hypothetical protein